MQELIEKLNMELLEVREKAALSPITAETLSNLSYRVAIMQLCVDAMDYLNDTKAVLPDEMITWLMNQKNTLDYLYRLWLECDYSFVPSLADVLTMEIKHDMGVSV